MIIKAILITSKTNQKLCNDNMIKIGIEGRSMQNKHQDKLYRNPFFLIISCLPLALSSHNIWYTDTGLGDDYVKNVN